jgi:hypothetical protein
MTKCDFRIKRAEHVEWKRARKPKCNLFYNVEILTEIFQLAVEIVNGKTVLRRKFEEREVK